MPRLLPVFIAASLLPTLAAAQATRPAEAAGATPAEQVAEAQSYVLRETALLAAAEEGTSLRARIVDGRLAIDFAGPVQSPVRLDLPGGPAQVQWNAARRAGRVLLPIAAADLEAARSGAPIVRYTQLFLRGDGAVSLSSDAEWLDQQTLSVELQQQGEVGLLATPAPVTLRVRINNDVAVSHDAETIVQLRQQHREDFDQHVTPLLRLLGLDDALAAETRSTAQAVFLRDLPVPADVETTVLRLASELKAADFGTRSRAQRELQSLGRPAATVLARADLSDATAEQRARVDALLDRYLIVPDDEAARLRTSRAFLEDVATLDDSTLAKAAREALAHLPPTTRPATAPRPAAAADRSADSVP
jgi:hypothetical protein